MDERAVSESFSQVSDSQYKILLVDDEEVVRHGMKYLIDWKGLGFRIAGDAGSSAEALELVASNHYDVLLTDIQMPEKTGLELIEEARRQNPEMKAVVISGYDSFDYAVTALRFGVEDYLLKPFSKERAQQVFTKLRDKLDEEQLRQRHQRHNEQMAISHFLYHLVQNDYLSDERIMEIENSLSVVFPLRMMLVNFCFANCAEYLSAHFKGDSRRLIEQIYKSLHEQLGADFDLISCQIGNNCVIVLPALDKRRAEELLAVQVDALGHACHVGVSEAFADIWSLSVAYCQTIEVLHDAGKYVNFYSSAHPVTGSRTSLLLACQNEILHMLECGRQEQISMLTQKAFAILRGQNVNYIYNWCLNSVYNILEYFDIEQEKTGKLGRHLFFDSGPHEDLLKVLQTFYEEQLGEVIRILQRLANDPNKRLIEKACAIIEQRYSDRNFSLNVVADEINISYGYLCTIFKQIKHEKFMDYLLRVRMQNAKRLLLQGDHKIYEIAEKTGYGSPRYFTLAFRKYFEMPPSEYLKKFGGKK